MEIFLLTGVWSNPCHTRQANRWVSMTRDRQMELRLKATGLFSLDKISTIYIHMLTVLPLSFITQTVVSLHRSRGKCMFTLLHGTNYDWNKNIHHLFTLLTFMPICLAHQEGHVCKHSHRGETDGYIKFRSNLQRVCKCPCTCAQDR